MGYFTPWYDLKKSYMVCTNMAKIQCLTSFFTWSETPGRGELALVVVVVLVSCIMLSEPSNEKLC